MSNPINAYIDNVSPTMNANSANKSSNITIVFTQEINPATINPANIKVFGYQTGLKSIVVDYNPATKTATLNPNLDFKYGEIISVTLTNEIKTSINENIIPFVYKFTIQAIGGNGIFTRSSGIDNIVSAELNSGDIDGDNDVDLVINNKTYKNNGNAVFTFSSELSMTGIPELADFDSDGALDILIENSGNIYFYRNDGTGNFIQTYVFNGFLDAYGDLDGDGYLDIAYLNGHNLITLKNNNGMFESDTTLPLSSCGSGYSDKIIIDEMNNDGVLDLIGVLGSFGGGIGPELPNLCRNYNLSMKSKGIFSSNVVFYGTVEGSTIIYTYRDSKTFDFNNDGYVDIISPATKLENNGNETFTDNQNWGFSFSLISDFNADGFIDVVRSITYAALVPLYTDINDGIGNFTPIVSNNGRFSSGSAGDFDNDGDIDVAAFDYNVHEVSILLNGDTPSPVELSSFSSVVNTGNVTLNWTTASEDNNKGFEVERSLVKNQSSNDWSKIGFVEGSGSTNAPNSYQYSDNNLPSGKYKYRLKQIDFNGNYKYYNLAGEVVIGVPGKFELLQNYPNPFNPNTSISYRVAANNFVSLKVFDNSGREIKTLVNEVQEAGYYSIDFNGSGLASGIYFYRMQTGAYSETKKMF
ncbi:MAG: FG-GAP-like repeat-containing protein, partial [Ignavibacteria bacterium]